MKSKYVVVDVESDGNLLGTNSMVCFGAVIVEDNLNRTFYGQTKPISDIYDPEALAISGFSRVIHQTFDDPKTVFENFSKWLKEEIGEKPILITDNNGYDASWINWYMLTYCGKNPFGWSSRRIGDIFCGWFNNMYYKWKVHRKTTHTHHPVDDAKGNAEALLWLRDQGFNLFK
jgi:hypothetical protein